MKTPLSFAVLFLACATPALVAAEAATSKSEEGPVTSSVDALAGNFAGTWRNETDSGKLRLSLKRDGDAWTAVVAFTYQEAEIPAKVTSLKVNGAKIELVAAWTIQESAGQSRMV